VTIIEQQSLISSGQNVASKMLQVRD